MSKQTNQNAIETEGVLRRTYQLIGRNYFFFVMIGLLTLLPSFLVELWDYSQAVSSDAATKYGFLFQVLFFIINLFLTATVVTVIGSQLSGEKATKLQCMIEGLKKCPRTVLLYLATGVAIGIATLLFVIPGLMVMCAVACAVPVLFLEDLKPLKAFNRSCDLTKGNRLRIFGYIILYYISLCIPFAFALVAKLVAGTAGVILAFTMSLGPFLALWPTLITVLYFDLKTRKETINLELRAGPA